MADFDEWLEDTRNAFDAIKVELATIQTALEERLENLNQFKESSFNLLRTLKSTSKLNGILFIINNNFRAAINELAFIGHDGEVLVSLDYLLDFCGINLNNLIGGDINSGTISVTQNETARLIHTSSDCCPVISGYLGIIIPIKVTLFSQERFLEVSTTIYAYHGGINNSTIDFAVANTLSYCPENIFTLDQGIRFLNLASPKVEAGLRHFGYSVENIDIGNKRTILYGATIGHEVVRIYTSFGLRKKRRMPLLQAIEPGYQIIMKLGNEFIHNAIKDELARNDLTIRNGPVYDSPTTFILTLALTYHGSVQIGCITINFTIIAGGKVKVKLAVLGSNKLVMTVDRLTEPEILESPLDWFPGLGEILEAVVNMIIRKISITVDFREEFVINQNQREMDVQLTDQFLLLKMRM